MVVIFVEAANGHLLFAAPQLALDVVVFPAVTGFQRQSAVGPELSFGAETMRGLDQCHRQSRANRSQRGNLPQFGSDRMLATLRQQFAPGLLAQVLQHVQLLIKLLSSAASAGLWNFPQPLTAIRNRSASLRASILSLLLPCLSSAFLRGLHTTNLATCGLSRS